MASYYFDNKRDEELAFASFLNRLANDIINRKVRLIEADHEREVYTGYISDVAVTPLTGRETLSIMFATRPSPNNDNNQ